MRRLALVAGVLGAGLGAFASYRGFEDIAAERGSHRDFTALATSETVQEARRAFYNGHTNLDCADDAQKPWCKYQEQEHVKVLGPDGKKYLFPPRTTKEDAIDYFKKKGITSPAKPAAESKAVENVVESVEGSSKQRDAQGKDHSPINPGWQPGLHPIPGSTSFVDKGGIKSITWAGSDFSIESIKTQDGRFLYSRNAPSVHMYLLHACWPVLGFLLPWGAIRVIAWVLLGFQQSSK
jgi:hypothetical protein